ncbi:MAG: DNA-binding protein Alba [Nanoarchaeota archaeon]|nr:DNA-binding protein Alba [Nanoarchaeota archaeon]MBU0978078.1 DNA-binding protein Alba [Nanoarchaeota archaeon]
MNELNEKKAPKTDFQGNDNTIFVGSKPLVNYIRGVITQFTKKDAPEVVIRSRGKFISKAVDVAEVARRSLEDGVKVKEVKIGSESFESEGKRTNISTMDITLAK